MIHVLRDLARVDALHVPLPRSGLHSNVKRSASKRAVLQRHEARLCVFRLHGYLLSGSGSRLVATLQREPDARGRTPLQTITDFEKVTASPMRRCQRSSLFIRFGRHDGVDLAFCAVPTAQRRSPLDAIESQRADGDASVALRASLDDALQEREERLLAASEHVDPYNLGDFLRGLGQSVYLYRPASASIVAATGCTLWRVTPERLDEMLAEDPLLASRFHRQVATLLAERPVDNGRQIRLLAQ